MITTEDVRVNRAAVFAVFSQTPAATVRAGTASRVATRCRWRFRCKGRDRRRGTRSPRHSDSTAPCRGKTEVSDVYFCLSNNQYVLRRDVCVCVCVCVCVWYILNLLMFSAVQEAATVFVSVLDL